MRILSWFRGDKSVLAFKALADLPMDDPGLFYPEGHPQAGQSRLARVTRYPEPDREKLRLHRSTVTPFGQRRAR